jgi:hypothetical protein
MDKKTVMYFSRFHDNSLKNYLWPRSGVGDSTEGQIFRHHILSHTQRFYGLYGARAKKFNRRLSGLPLGGNIPRLAF